VVAVAKLPVAAADLEPREHKPSPFSGQRIAALTLAGAGFVSLAVGIGFGVHSLNQAKQRDRLCPMPTQGDGCPAGPAVRAADTAILAGNIATAAWVVGGVALAGGVVLWVTGAPQEHAPAASLSVGPGSLRLSGVF
jgi:hypothetical protein